MAIRNNSLGGTDWGNEGLTYTDLNDTFDAATSKIQSLSAFWLNDELYDVYDDFDSYSTGAFTGNTKWSTSGDIDIVNSQNAGGTTNEVRIKAYQFANGSDTSSITSLDLDNNKHTYFRLYSSWGLSNDNFSDHEVRIIINGSTYKIFDNSFPGAGSTHISGNLKSDVLIIAKGSNIYDIYLGGKKVGNDVTITDLEIEIENYVNAGGSSSNLTLNTYIDDIRQSKSVIQ